MATLEVTQSRSERPMDRRDLIVITLGAALVVIGYEGFALLRGEELAVTPRAQAACPAAVNPAPSPPWCPDLTEQREVLEGCGFEKRVLRARLARYEGFEQPWPEELPRQLGAADFEGTLRGLMDEREEVELLDVDCDEYPCLAVLRSFEEEGWPALALHRGLSERVGEEVGIWNVASATELGGIEVSLQLVAPVLRGDVDEELSRRLDHRAEALLGDWTDAVLWDED